MPTKFLDPKNDIAFKKIFGTERNSDILIHFLNDILKFKASKPIQKVTFLPTEQDPDIASQKTSIVDILCEDEDKNSYIVEMQVAKTKGFEKRAQYYAAKAYTSKVNIGQAYEDLKEIIFVAIADYVMFPDKKGYKSDHVILDRDTLEQDLKDFSFTFIELPKFNTDPKNLSTLQEKWCYFFKHAEDTDSEDLKNVIGSDAILKRAYEELDRYYWTAAELNQYEQSEKRRRDELAIYAQKYDEGRAEEILSSVQKRLKRGHPIEEIAEDSGLSTEEIRKIQEGLN